MVIAKIIKVAFEPVGVPLQWILDPFDLISDFVVKSCPFVLLISQRWELPEHFFNSLEQDWVSINHNEHSYHVHNEIVDEQVFQLVLFDSNSQHVGDFHILEHRCLKESWESKMELFVVLVRANVPFHRFTSLREESHLWGEWLWV